MRCVIIAAADINDYQCIKNYLREDDYFIYCDAGLKHMDALKISPNLIVGDFDSINNPNMPVETIVLPREKDDTDTVYAVKEALKRGFDEFLIIGAVGRRLDHSLGNVSILVYLNGKGKNAMILDDYSEMQIVDKNKVYIEDRYSYFSLLNITGRAAGITIKNAKYELDNGIINCDYQYGISNEVISGKVAEVSVTEGMLLLVKIKNKD